MSPAADASSGSGEGGRGAERAESAEAPAPARPPLVRRRSLLASRPNKSPRPALLRRARSGGWRAAGPERGRSSGPRPRRARMPQGRRRGRYVPPSPGNLCECGRGGSPRRPPAGSEAGPSRSLRSAPRGRGREDEAPGSRATAPPQPLADPCHLTPKSCPLLPITLRSRRLPAPCTSHLSPWWSVSRGRWICPGMRRLDDEFLASVIKALRCGETLRL